MPIFESNHVKRAYYTCDKTTGKIKYKVEDEIKFAGGIEGYLVKIERKDEEYEGQPVSKLMLHLSDCEGKQEDVLQVGLNSWMAKDILNSLANVEEIGYVRITPYQSEYQGKMINHASIRHCLRYEKEIGIKEDYKVKRKYGAKDYPEVEVTIKKSGKEDRDSYERDKFFADLIPVVSERLKFHTPAQAANGNGHNFIDAAVHTDDNNGFDDEVPF